MRTHPLDLTTQVTQQPFGCSVHHRGRTSTIELSGELDIGARLALAAAVEAALSPGPVETTVVDMSAATFADSSTMGWLVAADARTKAAGTRLVVVAPAGPIVELLRLTGLDRQLALVHDGAMR